MTSQQADGPARVEVVHDLPVRLEQIVEVYRAGFDEDEAAGRRFAEESLPRHAGREDFRLALARAYGVGDQERAAEGRIVGIVYGYTGRSGQWWTEHVRRRVPAELADAWLDGHFEVVELAVLPAYRGRGLGAALHDALLRGLPHQRALLTTHPGDHPARRLYDRRGWKVLAPLGDKVLMGRRPADPSPADPSTADPSTA